MLRGRGQPVAAWRIACFMAGLAVIALALVSPIDWIGEERLFAVHMVQHVLLGDIAPLLLVVGLNGALLRPLLALSAVRRLRLLATPPLALAIWAADLWIWHLPGPYQAALRHDSLHAFEHGCFVMFGVLLWSSVLEPLPGPAWFGSGAKAVYILAIRLVDTALAFVFVWSQTVFFPYYAQIKPRLWGLGPLEDQNLAGVVMLIEGSILTIVLFGWLFLKWLQESELTDRLIAAGVPRARAARAVRFGRGRELLEHVEGPRRASPRVEPPGFGSHRA